jgi:phosphate-transporting ATPase
MLSVRALHRSGLEPVSFDLAAGECVVVRGDSGSGKTLLLRALADLDPNQGRVRLEGLDRDTLPAPHWRRRVLYVAAHSGWWGEQLGDHFADWTAAAPMVATLGLPDACREWPVARLSTGERQRLALVRALVLAPRVLLLDEPTSGLDLTSTLAVEALIQRHRDDGGGVLWVTHDAAQAARLTRRALLIESGRVTEGRL